MLNKSTFFDLELLIQKMNNEHVDSINYEKELNL